jgi:hypothetical protein
MGVRFVAALTLGAWTAAAQAPPPMFSPEYGEALRDILSLEESDAARLERQVAANPENFRGRLQLMAYDQRADRAGRPESTARRVRNALWLIEHHPESEILHSPVAHFSPGDLAEADYRRAVTLWAKAADNAAVQWNAASFFEGLDPELRLHYLERTAAADPNHPYALRPLAELYAMSMLEGGPPSSHAQSALDATKNVWVLGNAAYMLQSQYNLSVQRGTPNPRATQLAERYFLKAQALDPSLDRRKILPQLEQHTAAPARAAAPVIRTLAVAEFSELPPAIAGVLRSKNCKVPQPTAGGPRRNAIRGEFFTKREIGWAVLCSAHGSTTLLAFRNARDTNPDTVTSGGGDYPREITAAGRDFIVRHYRAYGGPEPPSIDHQGIDDAFVEKASVTWYFHQGRWLRLQGAD